MQTFNLAVVDTANAPVGHPGKLVYQRQVHGPSIVSAVAATRAEVEGSNWEVIQHAEYSNRIKAWRESFQA